MNIAFIACTKSKLKGSHQAKDIYIGDLFKKSFAYCSQKYDKVFILSAKYGLLETNQEISDYELTLNKMGVKEKKSWAENVAKQLAEKNIAITDELYFHCGSNYRKYLMPLLKNNSHEPLMGLGIGKQLGWYKKELNK